MRKLLVNFLLAAVMALATGEIAVRLLEPMLGLRPLPPYDTAVRDRRFGWLPKADYRFEGVIADAKGEEYPVTYTTGKHGFRSWGRTYEPDTAATKVDASNTQTHDPESSRDRPVLFFVGDSYTQAVEVGDGLAFYDAIGAALNAEVYAVGMAGWGSWQEALIVEHWIDSIRPDLVILQTCGNDFIDNHSELERSANYRVGLRRPYVRGDGTLYKAWPARMLDKISTRSRFVAFLRPYITPVQERTDNSEKRMAEEGGAFEPYAESLSATGFALDRMAGLIAGATGSDPGGETRASPTGDIDPLVGSSPLIAFSADRYDPQYTDMADLCQLQGIPWIYGPVDSLRAVESQGITVHTFDGYHWTAAGHRAIASALEGPIKASLHRP